MNKGEDGHIHLADQTLGVVAMEKKKMNKGLYTRHSVEQYSSSRSMDQSIDQM